MTKSGVWIAVAALWASAGWSAPLRARPELVAVRTDTPIRLDGKLDEPQWQKAPAFTDFVDSYPVEGAHPSQRTEVRVLYDDDTLYVGIVCFDSEPKEIVANLGRRDAMPPSDFVGFGVDSTHNGRTAYAFFINAAGTMMDSLLYDDTRSTTSWDAVWDAHSARLPNGWSAEFAIPLSILRFHERPDQIWGFEVQRQLERTHEQIDSVLLPRSENAGVSLFGELVGLHEVHPQRDLELRPYFAARATARPRYEADDRPHPRVVDPALDFGIDVKAALSTRLTLNAALNPDFGEVDPDQLILNLGNQEVFFGEQRTFFNQGLELFQPLSGGGSGMQMFYSRRIGLTAPILGAAKLTGSVRDGTSIGVLEAVVTGAQDDAKAPYAFGNGDDLSATDASPLDQRWTWHSSLPFHFGPNDALPAERPVPMNYTAVVARQKLWGSSALGATFTSALPLGQRCYPTDFFTRAAYEATDCAAEGGNALGLESALYTPGHDWGVRTQLSGSQVLGGGPQGWTQNDGVTFHGGDLGLGGYLQAGKFGGEPWQFNVAYVYQSPHLDLNPSGFQGDANLHQLNWWVGYTRPNGVGKLHDLELSASGYQEWSADGRHVPRGGRAQLDASVTLPNYASIGVEAGWEFPEFDIREIEDTGIPFQRRSDVYLALNASTDGNKPVSFYGGGFAFQSSSTGPMPAEQGGGWNLGTNLHPSASLHTNLAASYSHNAQGPRYVDDLGGGHLVFGAQHPGILSVTLRQEWLLTPKLTLQGYAQFFSAYAAYGPYFTATRTDRSEIRLTQLEPTSYEGDPSFHESALNLNVVLRWEYHLGSTLFLVYSRQMNELPLAEGRPVSTLAPNALVRGRATETFLVKWSYWWDV